MKRLLLSALLTCVLGVTSQSAHAVTFIDFETFNGSTTVEGMAIPSMVRQGVTVSFSTEDSTGAIFTPVAAQVGSPRIAFQSAIGDDTPVNSSLNRYLGAGDFMLTDGIQQTHDYIIDFSSPVSFLSMDLYDFNSDGPHNLGVPGVDTIFFEGYDAAGNLIASTPVTSPNPGIDGNTMNIALNVTNISKAVLNFGAIIEGGTAIDNLQFTVPEPSAFALTGLSLLGGLVMRRRRRA